MEVLKLSHNFQIYEIESRQNKLQLSSNLCMNFYSSVLIVFNTLYNSKKYTFFKINILMNLAR